MTAAPHEMQRAVGIRALAAINASGGHDGEVSARPMHPGRETLPEITGTAPERPDGER